MLHQKSRDKHINLGDSNTRYFYSLTKSKRERSNINSILDATSQSHDHPEEIMVNYFKAPGPDVGSLNEYH